MNALKTFVHQIETFGTFIKEDKGIKYYRIDTVTGAAIYYRDNGKPFRATFYYTY